MIKLITQAYQFLGLLFIVIYFPLLFKWTKKIRFLDIILKIISATVFFAILVFTGFVIWYTAYIVKDAKNRFSQEELDFDGDGEITLSDYYFLADVGKRTNENGCIEFFDLKDGAYIYKIKC